MARYSAGAETSAGSTTLPVISLYAGPGGAQLREVGVFNTASTAVRLNLVRLTTAGTQGAGLTEAKHHPGSNAAQATAFNTHTVAPTLGDDLGYRGALGAAIGSGVIWTFGDTGLEIEPGTSNGIGVIVTSGTGQVCDAYLVWDE